MALSERKHGGVDPHTATSLRFQRRRKLMTKRQIIIAIWSVTFAYLSLTATEVDSATTQIGEKNDVYPNSQAISNSVSVNQAHRRVLRQAVENVTESSTVAANDLLISTALNGDLSSLTDSIIGTTEDFGQSGSTIVPDLDIMIPGLNCTPPAIDDFPRDLFTPEQRRQGFLAIHFVASVYVFYCLALVCDDFFVPSIECICDELHLPSDVAGATFMAVATSSPELFTNVIGTFITQGDIGVGTIVGSAVFNLLGVTACCGIAAKTALPLEWYPLTRDCLFYSVAVILLIVFLGNRQVFWYEALVLVACYAVYILVMYKNTAIKAWAEDLQAKISSALGYKNNEEDKDQLGKRGSILKKRRASFVAELTASTERTPLLGASRDVESEPPEKGWLGNSMDRNGDIPAEVLDEMLISNALHKSQAQAAEEEAEWSLIRLPYEDGFIVCLQWIVSWPARFVLGFTVPDCREEKQRRLFPITFLMCIVWIALLSYVVSWLMTVIGHTLSIPDSVMGLTFIALVPAFQKLSPA
ncbi:Sodium/potassium/calcium exchanger 4 [Orchesella cincta]|uniref:Sodium/potassium/calcium exchanger 4 n=1 Tax=Orchesella cincta TaxID=48709 RepID=A0A1D2MW21_ORCCI|nr:Sodium/potassium/calcium exchanger 4 [Orchesella cincta]